MSVRCLWVQGPLTRERATPVIRFFLTGPGDQDLVLEGDLLSRLELVRKPTTGSGPPLLKRNAHILLLGGGDGITAEAGVMLAERFACRLSVVGRTAWPTEFPYPEQKQESELRARLSREVDARLGRFDRAKKEKELSRLLHLVKRQRALWQNRQRVVASGGHLVYAQADATDRGQLAAALASLRSEHGPFDGVIHGVGCIEDGPIANKQVESFRRVVNAKAQSAFHAYQLLKGEPLSFVFLFSSLVAYTGNVGQVDYVAANEILDALAHYWNEQAPYVVRSLAWSVWNETGLAPSWLRALMAQNSLPGITNEQGWELLRKELYHETKVDDQVLLTPEKTLRHALQGGVGGIERTCHAPT